jgi:hypothetical protein
MEPNTSTPTATPTTAGQPAACSVSLTCFSLSFAGVSANADGSATISVEVVNHCQNDVGYVALGSGSWSRLSPADQQTHVGGLGEYMVSWTGENGEPGFSSILFEPRFQGFSSGNGDVFQVTVADFDGAASFQVQAKAGPTRDAASFSAVYCQ